MSAGILEVPQASATIYVEDCGDLQAIEGYDLNENYVQVADIDCTGVDFDPIGDNTTPFTGSYNGGGYSISNLSIDQLSNYVGLFGYAGVGATISEVSIVNGSVEGVSFVGAIVGYNRGNIYRSFASATVQSSNYGIGGIAGVNYDEGVITDSYATGDVSSPAAYYVGGLVGINRGTIERTYASGNVTASSSAGGLVGRHMVGTISDSFALGHVTAPSGSAGGLVGESGFSLFGFIIATIENSRWSSVTTGASTCYGDNPLTDSETDCTDTESSESYFYDSGNPPLNGVWDFSSGEGYWYNAAIAPLYGGNQLPTSLSLAPESYFRLDEDGGTTATNAGTDGLDGDLLASEGFPPQFDEEAPAVPANVTSLRFSPEDGYQQYVSVDEDPTYNVPSGTHFTLSVMVKLGSADEQPIFSQENVEGTQGYGVVYGSLDPGIFSFYAEDYIGDSPNIGLATAITDREWHMVTFTYDGASLKGYLDGELDVSQDLDFSLNADDTSVFYLGAGTGNFADTYFNGWLDEFRLYHRVLNATEIAAINHHGHYLSSCAELQAMNDDLTATYTLMQNIDCTGVDFEPIGSGSDAFSGTFDGGGHVISNLSVTSATDKAGLFNRNSGEIRHVGIVSGEINSPGAEDAGGIAGVNTGLIEYSFSWIPVTSSSDSAGGLVGYNEGTIDTSYAAGAVTASDSAGGLVGVMVDGELRNSYASGDVSGVANEGGVVGDLSGGAVENVFAVGAVACHDNCGGVVGNDHGVSVTNANWSIASTGRSDCGTIAGNGCGDGSHALADFTWNNIEPLSTMNTAGGWWMPGGLLPQLDWQAPQAYYRFAESLQDDGVNGSSTNLSFSADSALTPTYDTSVPPSSLLINGNSIELVGSDTQYLSANTFNGTLPTSNLTVCGWVQTSFPDAVIAQQGRVGGDSVTEYVFRINPEGYLNFWDYADEGYGFDYGNVDPTQHSDTAVDDGSWHLACFVKQGTEGTYYVDGQEDGTVTAALDATYSSNDLVIGRDIRDSAAQFTGLIDDVRVYSRSLAAPELLAMIGGTVEISDCDEFVAINLTGLSRNYVQTKDIDCSTTEFTPIGSSEEPFTGTYDGGGHVISGVTYNNSEQNYVGLFARIAEGGTVENLGLIQSSITGQDTVGGLVAYNNGTISNCFVDARVTGEDTVGGLVGASNTGAVIRDSYVRGSVTGSSYVGGLVGYNGGAVTTTYAAAYVVVPEDTNDVGGLIGFNEGTLQNSFVGLPLTMSSGSSHGQLVGGNDGTVSNSLDVAGGSPDACIGSGTQTGCTDAETASFYDTDNDPLFDSTWDFTPETGNWVAWGNAFPVLSWQNPVLYLPLDGNDGEGGTTDISGHEYVATINGDATTNNEAALTDVSNTTGFTFDGEGDYLSISNAFNEELDDDAITVSAWVKANGTSFVENSVIVTEAYSGDDNVEFALGGNLGGDDAQRIGVGFFDGTWHRFSQDGTFPFGRWVHLAATYDGTTMKLYIDGELDSSVEYSLPLPAGTESWYVGRRWDTENYFYGNIDDVRIYNEALGDAQIAEIGGQPPRGHWNFDEGEGDVVADSSGYGNNGTLEPGVETGPQWRMGEVPTSFDNIRSLSFDGVEAYVNIDDAEGDPLDAFSAYTISAWVNPDEITGNADPIVSRVGSSTSITYNLFVDPFGKACIVAKASAEENVTVCSTSALDTSTWSHVAGVYDGEHLIIYVNGVEEGIATLGYIPPSTSEVTTQIGDTSWDSFWGQFHGLIDEPRVYGYALSPGQVLNLAEGAGASSGGICTPGLFWSLDEGEGSIATDVSDNGLDGTIVALDQAIWSTDVPTLDGENAYSLQFTQDGQGVEMNKTTGDEYTIAFWMKSDGTNVDDGGSIIGQFPVAGVFYADDAEGGGHLTYPVDGDNVPNSSIITSGEWHHVAIVINGSSGDYYLDGEADGAFSGAINFDPNLFGGVPGMGYTFFGNLDDLRIYDSALSGPQIAELAGGAGECTSGGGSAGGVCTEEAYWTFDEGEGSAIGDSTENNHDGTLMGDDDVIPSFSADVPATDFADNFSLLFDGTLHQKAEFEPVTLSGSFTIASWIKIDTLEGSYPGIVTDGSELGLIINRDGDTGNYNLDYYDSDTDYVAADELSSDTWYHVAAVNNAGVVTLYINGEEAPLDDDYGTSTLDELVLDTIGSDGSNYFDGNIDDVRIYRSALSQAQLAELAGGANECTSLAACGNGTIDDAEECDDDNTDNFDGCSSSCVVEEDWSCAGEPSFCTTACTASFGDDANASVRHGNTCYGIYNPEGGLSWDDAETSCEEMGGTLAVVRSAQVNALLLDHISYFVWIGARDEDGEGSYSWIGDDNAFWNIGAGAIDGAYSNWFDGEPNSGESACVELVHEDPYFGQWADDTCDSQEAYVCQFNEAGDDGMCNAVAYWQFDEGEGSAVLDESSNENDGTLMYDGEGGSYPTYSEDVPSMDFENNYSLEFDGSSSRVVVTEEAANIPVGSDSYTISAWIKPDTMGEKGIIGWGGYFSTDQVNAFRLTETGLVEYWWDDDLAVNTGDITGAWHHVASTFDGTWRRIYLDGRLLGADMPSGTHSVPNASNVTIGVTYPGAFFDGNIDDVRVYANALSSSQIQQLANGTEECTSPESTTVTWTGASGMSRTAWSDTGNWDPAVIPDETSSVVIPDTGYDPVLTDSVSVANLTIESGATLDQNGLILDVSGTFTNRGTLILSGNEGDVPTISTAEGTVMYTQDGEGGMTGGSTYHNLTLNDGLTGYWNFDDGEDGAVSDSSGYGSMGSYEGGAVETGEDRADVNFINDASLSLDGEGQYVDLGDTNRFDFGNSHSFTVAAWVNPNDVTGYQRIMNNGHAGFTSGWLLQSASSDGEGGAAAGIGADGDPSHALYFQANDRLETDTWTHVAAVFDQDEKEARLFYNGVPVAISILDGSCGTIEGDDVTLDFSSCTDINADHSADTSIGSYNGEAEYFNGNIDELRVYDYALSRNAIAALASGSEPATGWQTFRLRDDVDVHGDFRLNSGTLDMNEYTTHLYGSWLNNGGVVEPNGGVLSLQGGNNADMLSGGQPFYDVETGGGEGTWNARDQMNVIHHLSVAEDDALLFGDIYGVSAGYVTNDGTLNGEGASLTLNSLESHATDIPEDFNITNVESPNEEGMIAYWKFDQGNGDFVRDASGHTDDAELHGGPLHTHSTFETHFFNPYALHLDADNQYVSTALSLNDATQFTVAGWVLPRQNARSAFFGQNDVLEFGISAPGIMQCWTSVDEGGVNWSFDGESFALDQWHHVACVGDGTERKMYVDGELVATGGASIETTYGTSEDTFSIGGHVFNTSGDDFFEGLVDDVRVYDTAVSAASILNLWRGGYATGTLVEGPSYTLASNTTVNTLIVSSGELDQNGAALSVGQSLWMEGGLLTGSVVAFTVHGDVHLESGTFHAPNVINLYGNWNIDGGTFEPGEGIVYLNGEGAQHLNGTTTFHHLTINGPDSVYFEGNQTFTIEGDLSITHREGGDHVELRSSGEDPWYIDPQGERNISYADVQLSHNTNETDIDCTIHCIDSGDNVAWNFGVLSCGDGLVDGEEECDDGDETGDDGCSASCQIEEGWYCSDAEPSACYENASACTTKAHYQFESVLDGIATDASGNGFTGTIHGGVTLSNDVPTALEGGHSYALDGESGYIEANRPVEEDMSICAWIKTEAVGNGTGFDSVMPIVSADVGGYFTYDYGFGVNSAGTLTFGFGNFVGETDDNLVGATVVNTGEWTFVCGTRSGQTGEVKLYVNGAVDGSMDSVGTAQDMSSTIRIGYGNEENSPAFWLGNIADVRIYDGVLTEADIASLAEGTLSCESPCGNGFVSEDEQCDDGNAEDDDGCSSGCEVEEGWSCGEGLESAPSTCERICVSAPFENLHIGDECVFRFPDEWVSASWSSYRDFCVDEFGGHLTTVADSSLNTSLYKIMTQSGWIGLSDTDVSGTFVWVDDTDYAYQNWDEAQPDEAHHCTELQEDGTWRTVDCETEQGGYCTIPFVCGDGLHPFEDCDDGNAANGDGCSSTCEEEDGFVCNSEGDMNPSECRRVTCGDGMIDGDEECDDDNTSDHDGCSSTCEVEGDSECSDEPSICTVYSACSRDFGAALSINYNNETCFAYYAPDGGVTWSEAKADCETRGGTLATIKSARENDALHKLEGHEDAWIGGTDTDHESDFTWVDESESFCHATPSEEEEPTYSCVTDDDAYTNFYVGEPNNSGDNENCMIDYGSLGYLTDDYWNDADCGGSMSYICEFADPLTWSSSSSSAASDSARQDENGGGRGGRGGGGGGGAAPLRGTVQNGISASELTHGAASSMGHVNISVPQSDGKMQIFHDVWADDWFGMYVWQVAQKGIFNGYKDASGKPLGKYGPSDPITLAQLAKVSVIIGNRTVKAEGKGDDWAQPYLDAVSNMKLSLATVMKFDKNAQATRGQVVQALLEALHVDLTEKASSFSDVRLSSPYAAAIATAEKLGIISGDTGKNGKPTGTFRPDAPINRAEVAKMVILILLKAT